MGFDKVINFQILCREHTSFVKNKAYSLLTYHEFSINYPSLDYFSSKNLTLSSKNVFTKQWTLQIFLKFETKLKALPSFPNIRIES